MGDSQKPLEKVLVAMRGRLRDYSLTEKQGGPMDKKAVKEFMAKLRYAVDNAPHSCKTHPLPAGKGGGL